MRSCGNSSLWSVGGGRDKRTYMNVRDEKGYMDFTSNIVK